MTAEIKQWMDELNSDDPARRAHAAGELGKHGAASQAAAVSLAKCSGDPEERVREAAVASLESLGPPAAIDIAVLAALLNDDSDDVAYWAATLLGRLGPQGCAAAQSLSAVLSDRENVNVRQQAAWALGKIGTAANCALEPLQTAARSGDPRLARLAQEAAAAIEE